MRASSHRRTAAEPVGAVTGASAVELPAPCAGCGDLSASFGAAGSVDRRSAPAIGLTGGFGFPRSFCSAVFTSGFFFESVFGVDGCVDSFDTCAVGVAFGFGVSARGGAESVEAGVGGAVATDALSGLSICGAAGAAGCGVRARGSAELVEAGVDGAVASDALSGLTACGAAGAAGFGVPAGCAESVEAGVGGAVAIRAPSGLTACGAAVWTAGFGVPAGCAESVGAGVDGAVVIDAPSGLMICEGTQTAGELGGTGANAGAVDSKPEEARFGAPTSALPPAGTEPWFAAAAPAPGCVSRLPACRGAACGLSCIGARGELEGSRVCSVCGLTWLSVAAAEGSRSARSGALSIRAKLAQTAAAPASATPPAVSRQRRDLGLVDF